MDSRKCTHITCILLTLGAHAQEGYCSCLVCVCVCVCVCLSVTTLASFLHSKAGTWGVVIGFSWILTRGFSKVMA